MMSSFLFRARCVLGVVAVSSAAFAVPAAAADLPDGWPKAKPITWLVGFPPGGSVDVVTRVAASELEKRTGQSVVVQNRPGASGAIALQAAATAAPDGYTLITVPGPIVHAGNPPAIGKELRAVAMLAQGPMVLVAGTGVEPDTLAELVEAMRARPGAWSYGSSGTGTSQHLAGELFKLATDTDMVHVPYKGGGQAVVDVVGGAIPLAMLGVAPVLPHIQSGKLKAYAVTTSYRIDSLPDVPTMQEAGVTDYDATQWYAIAAPAATPPAVLEQLNAWFNEIMPSEALKASIAASGSVPGKGSVEETQRFVEEDSRRWDELVEEAGVVLE